MRPERAITPFLTAVDIDKDLIWHRDGRVTLVYRIIAFHEPALSDSELSRLGALVANVWSAVPEGLDYQFLTVFDTQPALQTLEDVFRPVRRKDERTRLYGTIRDYSLEHYRELANARSGASYIHHRDHYLCVSFMPQAAKDLRRSPLSLFARGRRAKVQRLEADVLAEVRTIDREVTRSLLDMGVTYDRLASAAIATLIHAQLSPTTAQHAPIDGLKIRPRLDADDLPASVLELYPWAKDVSPLWDLTGDPLEVHIDRLELGPLSVGILALQQLPDSVYPGLLLPLLSLNIPRYNICFTATVPDQAVTLAALRRLAKNARMAKLQNLFANSTVSDPAAAAQERQAQRALRRTYETSQRIVKLSLQVVVYADSAAELDQHLNTARGKLAAANGITSARETYALRPAFFSTLPGGQPRPEIQRRCRTAVMADLLPLYDFHTGQGRVAFPTPNNALLLHDPWSPALPNPHTLIFATSGAGKSFAMQHVLAHYEAHCLAHGDTPPRLFFLDRGGSYRRFLECRGQDSLHVDFTPDSPPGVDIFALPDEFRRDDAQLDTHVSRLTFLLLDLFSLGESNTPPGELNLKKAAIQETLFTLYRADLAPVTFDRLAPQLERLGQADLVQALYPYRSGSLARLFRDDPATRLDPKHNAVCWDLGGLQEHPDLARIALRLAIFQILRSASIEVKRRRQTFLIVDEAYEFLKGNVGLEFVVAALRQGRKMGLSVWCLSQNLQDFAQTNFREAILGNTATKIIGPPGNASTGQLKQLLELSQRHIDRILRLKANEQFREFLMIRTDQADTIRVPAHPLLLKLFSADTKHFAAWEALRRDYPDQHPFDTLLAWTKGEIVPRLTT